MLVSNGTPPFDPALCSRVAWSSWQWALSVKVGTKPGEKCESTRRLAARETGERMEERGTREPETSVTLALHGGGKGGEKFPDCYGLFCRCSLTLSSDDSYFHKMIIIYSCRCHSTYAIDHAPIYADGACKISSQRTGCGVITNVQR